MAERTKPETHTVLVVDDNEANRMLARETLEDEGYRVVVAEGGAEGIAAFDREKPDCALLDIRMQNVDGFAVCEHIRAQPGGSDVPVIFLTALRDVDTFDRARKVGGDDFLTKPVRPNELALRVQTALALKSRRTALSETLKSQRDDLLRTQLQKERLSAFVVHDLKNPVNAMDLHAQVLLRDKSLSPSARESVERIRAEARNLNRMILNLLDLSKGDEGKLVANLAPVDLTALVREVCAELEPFANARAVRLETAIATPQIRADQDLLRRTLANLVENAARHTPKDGVVRVSSKTVPEGVEICVADTGPGVPNDMKSKVFDPFVQLASDGKVSRSGRGLGLSFCKVAVEAHGGTIRVEDASPGAVFCVKLPQ